MSNEHIENLGKEINDRRKDIHTDSYPMSIGEVINMYKDGEIDVHPDFQREFRWSDKQKSRFIESILLGLPVPSFFVVQRDDGVWDVVDGMQRLSTILSFVGELHDSDNKLCERLVLQKTYYLPSLDGVSWDSGDYCFDDVLKRHFKRAKLDFQIIKKESDPDTKYELFQRLNTGGTRLSAQELRNCLLIMLDKEFYKWLSAIVSDNVDFKTTLPLTDKQIEERYDMELALRFLVLQYVDWSTADLRDVEEFITDAMREIIDDFDYASESHDFEMTFYLLNKALGENAFRKYNSEKHCYSGPFSLAIFEVMAIGLLVNIAEYSDDEISIGKIAEKSRNLPREDVFRQYSGSGVRASSRLPKLVPFGKEYFSR